MNNASLWQASQNGICVRRVWEVLDPEKNVNPSELSILDKIDDYWFLSHLRKFKILFKVAIG